MIDTQCFDVYHEQCKHAKYIAWDINIKREKVMICIILCVYCQWLTKEPPTVQRWMTQKCVLSQSIQLEMYIASNYTRWGPWSWPTNITKPIYDGIYWILLYYISDLLCLSWDGRSFYIIWWVHFTHLLSFAICKLNRNCRLWWQSLSSPTSCNPNRYHWFYSRVQLLPTRKTMCHHRCILLPWRVGKIRGWIHCLDPRLIVCHQNLLCRVGIQYGIGWYIQCVVQDCGIGG